MLSVFLSVGILLVSNTISIISHADTNIVSTYGVDNDNNRISDRLEEKIAIDEYKRFKDTTDHLNIIINLNTAPTIDHISSVEKIGGQVITSWDTLLYAMHVSLPVDQLYQYVKDNNDVVLIQENCIVNTTLYYSTKQIQARQNVWSNNDNVFPRGYTGNPAHSIAIIDTGIDDSHPDIGGRVIAWKDFIGEFNDESTADIYLTPTDRHGHGSHCAGIALGNGTAGNTQTTPGKIPINFANYFYPIEGFGWWTYYPIDTTNGPSSIDATLFWEAEEEGDQYYIWLTNSTGDGIGYSTGDTQPLTASTDVPVPEGIKNVYRVIFGTINGELPVNVDTNGTNYQGQILTPMNFENEQGDTFNLLTGVAPTCSLVGVKSLSDYGPGMDTDVINGMNWVYQKRMDFNIRVASLSLGGAPGEINPAEINAVENLVDNGVVVVCSAGNNQQNVTTPYVSSPALANKSIAVGSVNQNNQVSYYSSIGDPGNEYIKPDVVAPGGSHQIRRYILSVDSNDGDFIYKSYLEKFILNERFFDDYQTMQGTSMAAPHVSGLVGLMADAVDTWDYSSGNYSLSTKMIICMTACETNRPGEGFSPTLDRGGKDRVEGYGIVCADAAIEAITLEHTIGTLDTATLGDSPVDKKVWARQVNLSTEQTYLFTLDVPSNADYDLYIYSTEYETYGDPIILSKSTMATYGGSEIIEFTPLYNGTHYLVVKWVDGIGAFTISSDILGQQPEIAGVPVFSPFAVFILISVISLLGAIEMRRKNNNK